MTGWAPRRFWTEAQAEATEGGYGVALDGRRLRTPAKAILIVPTRPVAEAIAAEWDAQKQVVDPQTMPFTRSANSAIDKVTPQFGEIADLVAAYADSDLTCYRADSPQGLVTRQAAAWDPLLDWAAETYGACLEPRTGIVYRPQPAASLLALGTAVRGLSAFELTALHDLVAISGSLVIGLAALAQYDSPATLWALSRIDEDWQAELWGRDEQAAAAADNARAAFLHAARLGALLRP